MAVNTRKRKATQSLEDSTKRLRIVPSIPSNKEQSDDDEDGDGSYQGENGFSDKDDAVTADTPITPFSPGRKVPPCREKTLKCTFEGCEKTFNRPSRLATHLRSHSNERPFVCSYERCDKSYIDEKHLKRHIKSSHVLQRSYACGVEGCTKSFLTGTRLRRHQKVHEGENRFRCTAYPPCNQSFRKHQTLERHIRSEHLELAPFPCTYVDPETGEPCNAGFDGQGGLKKHQDRVHGIVQFFCPECVVPDAFMPDGSPVFLGFTTDTQLQAHIRKDHVSCLFCEKKFFNQPTLDKHVESQHSGKTLEERKNILCSYIGCGRSFTKRYNLAVHVRSVHEGQRYICGNFDLSESPDLTSWDGLDACGKDLTTKANLEDHVRAVHLGLPSLQVASRKKANPPSEKSKKSKPSVLDVLLGTAYENDERRTIRCVVPGCPNKFMRDYDLQNHIRSKHPFYTPDPDAIDEFAGEEIELADGLIEADYQEHEEKYDEADLDWEAQALELESGQFWIGADEDLVEENDEWLNDEVEMGRLIDGAE